jgi:hypothetical protein
MEKRENAGTRETKQLISLVYFSLQPQCLSSRDACSAFSINLNSQENNLYRFPNSQLTSRVS